MDKAIPIRAGQRVDGQPGVSFELEMRSRPGDGSRRRLLASVALATVVPTGWEMRARWELYS